MLVDTHAHLQMNKFNRDRDAVVERAKEAGVAYIINASFDIASSHQAVRLAEEYDNLYAAVGVHPHDAKTLNDRGMKTLRKLAEHPKVVAIGEIGLDYYRDLSPRDIQKQAFENQIRLAKETNLPIIIHNRDAHDDTLAVLKSHGEEYRGVMHCFSGDMDFADKCIQLGLYISFAGPVTYPKSHDLREVAAEVGDDAFFVETDCPYLTPQFRRSKRNEPAYVRAIAEKIAEIRRVSLEEIAKSTTANAKELFGIG